MGTRLIVPKHASEQDQNNRIAAGDCQFCQQFRCRVASLLGELFRSAAVNEYAGKENREGRATDDPGLAQYPADGVVGNEPGAIQISHTIRDEVSQSHAGQWETPEYLQSRLQPLNASFGRDMGAKGIGS